MPLYGKRFAGMDVRRNLSASSGEVVSATRRARPATGMMVPGFEQARRDNAYSTLQDQTAQAAQLRNMDDSSLRKWAQFGLNDRRFKWSKQVDRTRLAHDARRVGETETQGAYNRDMGTKRFEFGKKVKETELGLATDKRVEESRAGVMKIAGKLGYRPETVAAAMRDGDFSKLRNIEAKEKRLTPQDRAKYAAELTDQGYNPDDINAWVGGKKKLTDLKLPKGGSPAERATAAAKRKAAAATATTERKRQQWVAEQSKSKAPVATASTLSGNAGYDTSGVLPEKPDKKGNYPATTVGKALGTQYQRIRAEHTDWTENKVAAQAARTVGLTSYADPVAYRQVKTEYVAAKARGEGRSGFFGGESSLDKRFKPYEEQRKKIGTSLKGYRYTPDAARALGKNPISAEDMVGRLMAEDGMTPRMAVRTLVQNGVLRGGGMRPRSR